jgi:uncharacterized RDD family membrane protein YckC
MKCPKCGYLGFETSDRCRNCGYDFSLSVQVDTPAELPLRSTSDAGGPLADFDLTGLDTARTPDNVSGLDLDRLIGVETPPAAASPPVPAPSPVAVAPRPAETASVPQRPAASAGNSALPLFTRKPESADDAPLITAPRPVRPPLSVRRATPDVVRGRSRTPRPAPRDPELTLQLDTADRASGASELTDTASVPADTAGTARVSAGARIAAAAIDLVIVGGIDAAVIYFTLAIAGLTVDDAAIIPRIPMAAFLVLLNGGYLVAFVAASGQTIGKMVTGIRVMRDDGGRVDIAGAALRAAGCAVSLLTAGLGYLPAFVTADGRALHDRLAGTRVVPAR